EAEAGQIERRVGARRTFGRPGIVFRRAGFQFIRGELHAAEATANELLTIVRDLGPTRPDAGLMYGLHIMNIRFVQGRSHELLPSIAALAAEQPDSPLLQA